MSLVIIYVSDYYIQLYKTKEHIHLLREQWHASLKMHTLLEESLAESISTLAEKIQNRGLAA